MNNLAVSYRMVGRLADAAVLTERVFDYHRRFLPENHPDLGDVDIYDTKISSIHG